MIHVALYEPEIPPNTGNIIRLCANTGAKLHLIHPLGFLPNDKKLQRAGLDYHEWTLVRHYQDYSNFFSELNPKRLIAYSTHGKDYYTEIDYCPNDVLLFGPETRGLPKDILTSKHITAVARIPMAVNSRSLNLSNAVAIVVYEALRQIGFNMVNLI